MLNLKVTAAEKPSDETLNLIRENRDALIAHLAAELVGTGGNRQSPGLTLHGDLLHSLMLWTAQYHELHLERPGAVVLNAKPEHVRDAVKLHLWGVVYDTERFVLASWGDVPMWALAEKRDLATGEPLLTEAVAA